MAKVYRGTCCEGHVRVFYATSEDITNEVARRNEASYLVKTLLGRFIPMGLILQENQKQGWITCKINCDGDIGLLELQCNEDGDTRVHVKNPKVEYDGDDFLNFSKAIGNGTLEVIKDLDMKQRFSSSVELASGKIGEDFAAYFDESEQIESLVVVGSTFDDNGKVKTSNALVFQLLPDARDVDRGFLFNVNIPSLAKVEEGDIVENLKNMFDVDVLSSSDYKFKCHCSLDRYIHSLSTLDIKDLEEMRDCGENTEITCGFCNQKYLFTPIEIQEAIDLKKKC